MVLRLANERWGRGVDASQYAWHDLVETWIALNRNDNWLRLLRLIQPFFDQPSFLFSGCWDWYLAGWPGDWVLFCAGPHNELGVLEARYPHMDTLDISRDWLMVNHCPTPPEINCVFLFIHKVIWLLTCYLILQIAYFNLLYIKLWPFTRKSILWKVSPYKVFIFAKA